jgi:UDP-N-acetylmuramate dehydrogenase
MVNQLQELLTQELPQLNFKFDYPVGKKSYFKVGGNAESYIELKDPRKVQALLKFIQQYQVPLRIIGGLSNVIVADQGIKGIVLKITHQNIEVIEETSQHKIIRVGAGIAMQRLVMKTVELELTGLENFFGVPGNLGGSIYNNSHYLKDLIGEYVERVQVIDQYGEIKWLDHDECNFKYDHSRFQSSKELIWEVEFKLEIGDKKEAMAKIKKAQDYRGSTQPLSLPSSGCIFQNTLNTDHLRELFPQFADRDLVPTGFLIDQAGLKGYKKGDLEVSAKHAAFIVNHGSGTAQELKEMIEYIKQIVKQKFDADLHEEVFYLE